VLCLFCVRSPSALADSPTTAPTTQESPQEALAKLDNVHLAKMTPEQAASFCSANTDAEKQVAAMMAKSAIAVARLEVATREKWGKDAETAVAHICTDDTADDDAQATWTVQDDHAVAHFKLDTLNPVFLVRVGDNWKLDVAAYVATSGNQVPEMLLSMRRANAVLNSALEELNQKQTFNSADDFTAYLKQEMEKLAAPAPPEVQT
jgi:hypothetical protein